MNNITLLVFPAPDLEKAKKFYTTFLGTEPYYAGPHYAGYKLGDLEVGLDPNGKAVVSYIDVENIEDSLKNLTDAGAEIVTDKRDVGGGMLIAQVTLEDNVLGLRQKAA